MKLTDLLHENASWQLSDKQRDQLTKARNFGWKLSDQYAVNKSIDGIAVTLLANGNNAVLYPDGTMDRGTAQQSGKLKWRAGWHDPVAASERAAREKAAWNAIAQFMKKHIDNLGL